MLMVARVGPLKKGPGVTDAAGLVDLGKREVQLQGLYMKNVWLHEYIYVYIGTYIYIYIHIYIYI